MPAIHCPATRGLLLCFCIVGLLVFFQSGGKQQLLSGERVFFFFREIELFDIGLTNVILNVKAHVKALADLSAKWIEVVNVWNFNPYESALTLVKLLSRRTGVVKSP